MTLNFRHDLKSNARTDKRLFENDFGEYFDLENRKLFIKKKHCFWDYVSCDCEYSKHASIKYKQRRKLFKLRNWCQAYTF